MSTYIFKLCSLFLTVYIFIAIVTSFVDHSKYIYSDQNYPARIATTLLQPFMNVLGNGKITHCWHFKTVENFKIDNSMALDLNSVSFQKRDLKNKGIKVTIQNSLADLGWAREAAILEPINYQGKWKLVFCDLTSNICQKSTLLHKGSIKVLVDGYSRLAGEAVDGSLIQLKLVELIDVGTRKDILFI